MSSRSRSGSPAIVCAVDGDAQGDLLLQRERSQQPGGLGHQPVEPDIGAPYRELSAVGTREHQQTFDERLHPGAGALADLERLLVVGGRPVVQKRPLELGHHRRHRRPQLVRRVGSETALPLDRLAHAIERKVEGGRNLTELRCRSAGWQCAR